MSMTDEKLRDVCMVVEHTPPNGQSTVAAKSDDGVPYLLRRWNGLAEEWNYAGETPDGGIRVYGNRANAVTFETHEAAQMWRAERPYFTHYEPARLDARSLPPEDEDEPEGDRERERERAAECLDAGDIGQGPEMLGANLPRFVGREP
jgi:hypothetical protein